MDYMQALTDASERECMEQNRAFSVNKLSDSGKDANVMMPFVLF